VYIHLDKLRSGCSDFADDVDLLFIGLASLGSGLDFDSFEAWSSKVDPVGNVAERLLVNARLLTSFDLSNCCINDGQFNE